MKITLIVTELALNKIGDKFVCYHKFDLPDFSDKYALRSRRRCNVFFNNGKPGRNKTKTRLFIYRHENEPEVVIGRENALTIEHENIEAFFEYIEFDYKTKKYIDK